MASQPSLGVSPPLQHMGRSGNDPHERDGIPEILSNVQDNSGIQHLNDRVFNQSTTDRKMKIKVLVQTIRVREWILAQA